MRVGCGLLALIALAGMMGEAFLLVLALVAVVAFVVAIVRQTHDEATAPGVEMTAAPEPAPEPEPVRLTVNVEYSTYPTYGTGEKLTARADDLWLPPGRAVTVHGFDVPNGMLYVGQKLAAVDDAYRPEPALIDPELPVDARRPDVAGETMSYWPSYSQITPAARAAYLRWLAGGRADPGTYVGYVFLFFYGLERRLVADAAGSQTAAAEAPALVAEIERLLEIYGENQSFRGYASRLLAAARARFPDRSFYDAEPGFVSDYGELPLDVRLATGQLVAEGKPIPADWALAWSLGSLETRMLRTPARRCWPLFRKLFRRRYAERHGPGLKIRRNKTPLVVKYYGASAGLRGLELPCGDLPDVARLKGPVRRIGELVERTTDELDAYSRWLGRNAGAKNPLPGLAFLPSELVREEPCTQRDAVEDWARQTLGDAETAVAAARSLFDHWPTARPDRMVKKEAVGVAQLLEKLGYGLEPDVRFGGRPLRADDAIVLFRLPPDPPEAPSAEYAASALLLHLAAAVATSDGTVSAVEEQHLEAHLETALGLDAGEKTRLRAYLRWLLENPPGFAGVKKRLASRDERQRRRLARFAVATASADGVVDPAEVKILERVYGLLGLDAKAVYSDVHALTAGTPPPATEPVTVRPASPRVPGAPVPPPARDPGGLDPERLRARLQETAAVTSMLADVFVDEDETDASSDERAGATAAPAVEVASDVEATAAEATVAGLDAAHSAFLRALGERPEWTRDRLETLAERCGLLPDGAIDKLNETALELCGEPVLEGDEEVYEVYDDVWREVVG